jgi:hypothetical protein
MNKEGARKRMNVLLLGAIDMEQVMAAVEAIQDEERSDNPYPPLLDALETAAVVCYWRPFSQSNTVGHLSEKDAFDVELHEEIRVQRDQAHAHIDLTSGRSADIKIFTLSTGERALMFGENRWGLPSKWLPRLAAAALHQRDSWRKEAERIKQRFHLDAQ